MSPNKICITGASGFVGGELVNMLLSAGFNIHILSRDKKKIFPKGTHITYGDLAIQNESLENFLDNCDILFHCDTSFWYFSFFNISQSNYLGRIFNNKKKN